MYEIYYAVLALTKIQSEELIPKLKEDGMDILADWLEQNKDEIYGELPENWRPFKGNKIIDLINENSSHFISETHLISEMEEDCSNADSLSNIQIFFIDFFTMFVKKYENLASIFDYSFRNAEEGNCCFIMNFAMPIEVQEQLEKRYRETWRFVSKGYQNGSLHRMAVRVDDFKNFKNFLGILFTDQSRPSPANSKKLSTMFEPDRAMPKLGD